MNFVENKANNEEIISETDKLAVENVLVSMEGNTQSNGYLITKILKRKKLFLVIFSLIIVVTGFIFFVANMKPHSIQEACNKANKKIDNVVSKLNYTARPVFSEEDNTYYIGVWMDDLPDNDIGKESVGKAFARMIYNDVRGIFKNFPETWIAILVFDEYGDKIFGAVRRNNQSFD